MASRKPSNPRKPRSQQDVIKQQMGRTIKFPVELEGWYVERYETNDPHGDQVRRYGKIESFTAADPIQMRNFGNKMKVIAGNTSLYNVMITTVQSDGTEKSIVYPRKVPKAIEDVTKTTDEIWRGKVKKELHEAKVETQGIGDFDKKPDFEDVIDLMDEEEEE